MKENKTPLTPTEIVLLGTSYIFLILGVAEEAFAAFALISGRPENMPPFMLKGLASLGLAGIAILIHFGKDK